MGEKKRRLSALPPGQARFDGRLLARAFEALEAGDRETRGRGVRGPAGEPAARPRRAERHRRPGTAAGGSAARARAAAARGRVESPAAGVSLPSGDRLPESRHSPISPSRSSKPRSRSIRRWRKRIRISATCCSSAATTQPPKPRFVRALALRRDYPFALFGLGEARLAQGRCEEACADFERRSRSIPRSTRRGTTCRAPGRRWWPSWSAPSGARVRRRSWPTRTSRWKASWPRCRSRATIRRTGRSSSIASRNTICGIRSIRASATCCSARSATPRSIRRAWCVRSRASWPRVPRPSNCSDRLSGSGTRDAPRVAGAAKPLVRGLLGDALLQRLLEEVVVPNIFVERLRRVRAPRLAARNSPRTPPREPSLPLPAIVAMAHQCFNTEYVHDESDAEKRGGRGIARRDRGRAGGGAPGAAPLVRRCTRAIARCTRSMRRTRSPPSSRRPRSPRSRAADPRAAGGAAHSRDDRRADGGGRRSLGGGPQPVRGQSVPAMAAHGTRRRADRPSRHFCASHFPEADLAGIPDAPARILVAGCGTGRHPIGTARRFPDSSVLAVDLSLTSLAYAVRKTRELGIGNIEYRQADILALGALPSASTSSIAPACCITSRIRSPAGGSSARCCAPAA